MNGYREFQEFAREEVAAYWNEQLGSPKDMITAEDVYICWYAKELQNQKAMLSADRDDGLYFEMTYNGDKNEAYLDAYRKVTNRAIKLGD